MKTTLISQFEHQRATAVLTLMVDMMDSDYWLIAVSEFNAEIIERWQTQRPHMAMQDQHIQFCVEQAYPLYQRWREVVNTWSIALGIDAIPSSEGLQRALERGNLSSAKGELRQFEARCALINYQCETQVRGKK
ncbi:hypothetical protein [uncultured Umboniibacter sp.]|uniref:hypothetical protein n=1 Tax=uncultured Umboniibacter sp. TaxID=1798917 RepID=UPI002622FAE3|nr:hypothetical protein [uncultured Umboniibacter sp.]